MMMLSLMLLLLLMLFLAWRCFTACTAGNAWRRGTRRLAIPALILRRAASVQLRFVSVPQSMVPLRIVPPKLRQRLVVGMLRR
jgi:hypothetical protein